MNESGGMRWTKGFAVTVALVLGGTILFHSSFVREPTAVVRRAALEAEGLFDTSVGDAADTDMWVRLFSRFGARCLPQATCAYTIH